MLLIFLPVFTAATALAIYRAYKALSQSSTAVAPQELMRFLTFGGIVNKRLRALSLLFHVAIITSLFGHFFMFVKEVPPALPKLGTAMGLTATAALALLVAGRLSEKDREYLLISTLLLLTAATGTAMSLAAPREYVVEIALSLPQTLDAASVLLVVHVICATTTAAAVPYTLMSHVATPVAYLAVKSRRLEKA
jgi:nitrate reductase gamma subunit